MARRRPRALRRRAGRRRPRSSYPSHGRPAATSRPTAFDGHDGWRRARSTSACCGWPRFLVCAFGVLDVVGLLGLAARIGRRAALGRRLLLVERRTHLLRLGGELLHRRLDGVGVGALQGLLGLAERGVDAVLHVAGQVLVVVLDELLRLVDERLRLVADLGLLAALLVLLGVLLDLAHHAVDLVLGQRRAAGDRHALPLAGPLFFGGNVPVAVASVAKGRSNWRPAPGGRRRAGGPDLARFLVLGAVPRRPREPRDRTERRVAAGRVKI